MLALFRLALLPFLLFLCIALALLACLLLLLLAFLLLALLPLFRFLQVTLALLACLLLPMLALFLVALLAFCSLFLFALVLLTGRLERRVFITAFRLLSLLQFGLASSQLGALALHALLTLRTEGLACHLGIHSLLLLLLDSGLVGARFPARQETRDEALLLLGCGRGRCHCGHRAFLAVAHYEGDGRAARWYLLLVVGVHTLFEVRTTLSEWLAGGEIEEVTRATPLALRSRDGGATTARVVRAAAEATLLTLAIGVLAV